MIEGLARIAFSDISKIKNSQGVTDLEKLSKKQLAAIQDIDFIVTSTGKQIQKVRNCDRTKALELLGKHFGIFEKDNAQKKDEFDVKIQNIISEAEALSREAQNIKKNDKQT